jgi:peroxiredoxin
MTDSSASDLQQQLDTITANTRSLVQPERLAITDDAVEKLFSTGIEDRILPVGSTAPAFALPGASPTVLTGPGAVSGKLIRSTDLLSLGPLIVKFFRGRWCPYCVTELEAWQASYTSVRERGALLVAISPQLPRQNDFTVQQHHLSFPVVHDNGCRVAESFGVVYSVPEAMQRHYRAILVNIPFINGDDSWRLPLPATFVLSSAGKVLFAEAHADHRVRPEPQDVLAVL